MKILLINNFHYLRGGAERAYFDSAEVLKKRGHKIAFFSMQHQKNLPTAWSKYFIDEISYSSKKISIFKKIIIAGKIIFNFQAKKNLEKLIEDFRPDIAHLHNFHHQLSPSIIWALKKYKIPIVATLHDYKLVSPNYNLFLNGSIWEKKSSWECICDKCVKNSHIKTIVCILESKLHKLLKTYEKVDTYTSPSKFLIKKYKEFNFPYAIKYIPNPLIIGEENNLKSVKNDPEMAILYFGRLSIEKGIDVAIDAIKILRGGEKLWIIGSGPHKKNLQKKVNDLELRSSISFLGVKYKEDLKEFIEKSKAIIIPSIWFENMPYVLLESMALGKVVIASKIGGISEVIEDGKNGFLFIPNDPYDLAQKITSLENEDLNMISNNAQKSIEARKSDVYLAGIEKIYYQLIHK